MSKTLLLVSAALVAPLIATSEDVQVAFSVAEGTSLTTTYSRVLTLELASSELSMVFDGDEEEAEAMEVEMTIIETENLTFTDAYTQVEGGRVGTITRTFDELTSSSVQRVVDPGGEGLDEETPGGSELESVTVVFSWDEEEQQYATSLGEGEQDVDLELLEELDAVADFTWFLPSESLEEGDTWEIDLDAFRHLSAISGELGIVREGEEDEPEDDFGDQFDENLSGEMAGEFKGLREADGLQLAVLRISAELETSIEQSEQFEEDDGRGSLTDSYEFSFELEGELLWDLEGGHAHSFEFAGDCVMLLTSEQEFSGDGHEVSFTTLQEFEGDIAFQVGLE